jgi:thiosulfate/3-mercaptopyruvate sulfurtransferase
MRTPILFTVFCAAAVACGSHGTRDSMLVSTAWLAGHLRDSNLVLLSVGDAKDYAAAHIPGALQLDYASIHTGATPGRLTVELPPMKDLVEVFTRLGLNNDSHIVLYFVDDNWASRTTRVFLTLDAMGLGDRTSLVDGGFAAWKNESRPVTADVRPVTPGKLTPCPPGDVVTDVDYVRANLHRAGVHIIDARDAVYYTGDQHGNGKRPGHIPGSTNLTFSTLFDASGKFKSPDVMAAMFREAGVRTGDRVVSYCHIGQQATVVYFVARYLGYDARMYDGSWEDWSAHTELPAEK